MDKYEKFKLDVFGLTKLDLSCYKEKQMKRRISSLITKNNYKDFDDYFLGLCKDKILYEEFINYVTINVSEFFRNSTQWDILEKNIIPSLIKNNKKIKIWSSACSTGEEPYSLAIVLSNLLNNYQFEIIASDIDDTAIKKAKNGIYNLKNLNKIPSKYRHYFHKQEDLYSIDESIKKCISFKKINLLEDNFPKDCNLILCRNVMIYFTEAAKSNLYNKFNNSLASDGVLFVGSTEQIILPNKYNFKLVETFFYQKMDK